MLARALALAVMTGMSLSGCAASPEHAPTEAKALGTDASLPGVEVRAKVSADEDLLRIDGTAWNNGTRTWKVAVVCASPWALDFEVEGDPFTEVQCAAIGPPRDWLPGENHILHTAVQRDDFNWGPQTAKVTVTFHAWHEEGSGSIRVPLVVRLP